MILQMTPRPFYHSLNPLLKRLNHLIRHLRHRGLAHSRIDRIRELKLNSKINLRPILR